MKKVCFCQLDGIGLSHNAKQGEQTQEEKRPKKGNGSGQSYFLLFFVFLGGQRRRFEGRPPPPHKLKEKKRGFAEGGGRKDTELYRLGRERGKEILPLPHIPELGCRVARGTNRKHASFFADCQVRKKWRRYIIKFFLKMWQTCSFFLLRRNPLLQL